MLTITDLRYLLRLVQRYDCWEAIDVATRIRRSARIEAKLAEMIGRARRKDRIVDANTSTSYPMDTQTAVYRGACTTEPRMLTIYRSKGGETMGKTSKAAPKKPKGKIGKAVKTKKK